LGIDEIVKRNMTALVNAIEWLDNLGELEAMKEEKVKALESRLIEQFTPEGVYTSEYDIDWDLLDDIDVFPLMTIMNNSLVRRGLYVQACDIFWGNKEERKEMRKLRKYFQKKYYSCADSTEQYTMERERQEKAKKTIKDFVRKIQYKPYRPFEINKISLSELKKHSYITGKSGSGKSELLKLLFYRLAKESNEKKSRCLMLLDPHGDLAQECKNLHLFDSDRIIYIDPYFQKGYTPIINPFELSERDELSIEKRCQELTETITEIVSEQGLSSQMKTILNPCISTLLRMENATIKDLQTFMDDENNGHLVAKGKQSPLQNHRDFFNTSFHKTGYNPTKLSIYTKLQTLLNSYTFYKFTNGKSTIDLQAEINKGKVIIFNLSKGVIGTEVSNAIGRFIIAITKSIALSRADGKQKRKNIFLFIDECHNYISPSIKTILQEARKYGLHLVLSNQIISDFSPNMKKAILSNTAIKIAGKNNKDTRTAIASEIGIKATDISELPKYHFFIKSDDMQQAKILQPPTYLLDTKGRFYLTKEQQEKQKAYLLKMYYKKTETNDSSDRDQNDTEERKRGQQEQTPTNHKPKPRFDI